MSYYQYELDVKESALTCPIMARPLIDRETERDATRRVTCETHHCMAWVYEHEDNPSIDTSKLHYKDMRGRCALINRGTG